MITLKLNPTTNTYDFETEQMEGSIQPEGVFHGVTRLLDKRTGRQVIDPKSSALCVYRVLGRNQCLGLLRQLLQRQHAILRVVTRCRCQQRLRRLR